MDTESSVDLKGYLAQDPELKYLESGKAVCKLVLPLNTRRRSHEDSKPYWMQVSVFGDLAEAVNLELSKGSCVVVHGRLSASRWETEGVLKANLAVVASRVGWYLGLVEGIRWIERVAAAEGVGGGEREPDEDKVPF